MDPLILLVLVAGFWLGWRANSWAAAPVFPEADEETLRIRRMLTDDEC